MIQTGENHYTLPHLYSCTGQFRLLRDLLLAEEGEVLWIGQGIPREWLAKGKHVAVKSAVTVSVTYVFDQRARRRQHERDARSADAQRTERDSHPPRDPQKRPIAEVVPETNVDHTENGETITLKNVTKRVRLHVSF